MRNVRLESWVPFMKRAPKKYRTNHELFNGQIGECCFHRRALGSTGKRKDSRKDSTWHRLRHTKREALNMSRSRSTDLPWR